MTNLSKAGAAAILSMAVVLAPASAAEHKLQQPEHVRTVAIATPALEIAHRNNQRADAGSSESRDSNGWGMLAAGLGVGLLIIARRRRS